MNSLLQLVQGKGSSGFCLWIFLGIQSRCVISSHYELACHFSMMTKMKRLFHRSHKNISFLVCEQGYGIWDHAYQQRFDIDIQMVFHHCEPLCGSLMSVFSLKIVFFFLWYIYIFHFLPMLPERVKTHDSKSQPNSIVKNAVKQIQSKNISSKNLDVLHTYKLN